MDVTPQELRDIEIRESFRGYHRDEVDELLERAAATIEHLEHQIRILQERLASGPTATPATRPAPAPAAKAAPVPAVAPAPVPAPAPAPVPMPDGDVIQRTLILAQRAADEAVADAQARAAQLTGDAEAKAQAMVTEAETTARRIAESERRRIETEIAELSASRDALSSDVDVLERFASEYRDRIKRAIEAELAYLAQPGTGIDPSPPRPVLQSRDVVTPLAAPAPAAELAAAPPRSVEPDDTSPVPIVEAFVIEPEPEPEPEPAWSPEPAGGWDDVPSAPADDTWGGAAPAVASSSAAADWGSESLDDDAFFASLREAVRDDEPLGPRDPEDEFYDEDPDGARKLFRRRR